MADLITPLSTALSLASRLREISANIRDAEFKNLLADLNLQLADAKMQMADLMEQNRLLVQRVRELEQAECESCPKCRKRTWELQGSRPDPMFGQLGGMRRTYKCSSCGFSEETLLTPK